MKTRRWGLQKGLTELFNICLNNIINDVYLWLLFLYRCFLLLFCWSWWAQTDCTPHSCMVKERSLINSFWSTYLKVIIVIKKVSQGRIQDWGQRKFSVAVKTENNKWSFVYITVIDIVTLLPNSIISADTHHKHLKKCLMNASDHVQKNKEDTQFLFSVTHFAVFFSYTCEHFSKATEKPFNFINTSRSQNSVGSDLWEHLSEFLKHMKTVKKLMKFAASMIALSLLLNNYSSDLHSKFSTFFKTSDNLIQL
jgi:hypothetical protein